MKHTCMLEKAVELLRAACDPFLDIDLDEEQKKGLVEAMRDALDFLGPLDECPIVKCSHDGKGMLTCTISMPAHVAMALTSLGLLCPHCTSTKTEEADPPGNYRRCCNCGEYLSIRREQP